MDSGFFSTPVPRFDLIINKKIGDFLPVQAGRGCPNTCSFCSVSCLYKGHYVKELGFKKFLLLDDNIFSDRDYLHQLLKEIKKLNMEWMSQCSIKIGKDDGWLKELFESGCRTLSFGLESISKESLVAMNKSWADSSQYPRLIRIMIFIHLTAQWLFTGLKTCHPKN